jgi:16S rRNA (guanine527-N7)-methyltransferase
MRCTRMFHVKHLGRSQAGRFPNASGLSCVGPLQGLDGAPRMAPVLDETRLGQILSPFGISLTAQESRTVLVYLDLLLRWNRRINLTAIRSPEECVTRHFGESLYLAKWVALSGRLLDVGSGAGFPGLALKIAEPELPVTLLEPVAKKRAFLKEVARGCGFDRVEVRGERLEDYLLLPPPAPFDLVTARAVGNIKALVQDSAKCLAPGGHLCLWLSQRQAAALARQGLGLTWQPPIHLPLGRERQILVGRKERDKSCAHPL